MAGPALSSRAEVIHAYCVAEGQKEKHLSVDRLDHSIVVASFAVGALDAAETERFERDADCAHERGEPGERFDAVGQVKEMQRR